MAAPLRSIFQEAGPPALVAPQRLRQQLAFTLLMSRTDSSHVYRHHLRTAETGDVADAEVQVAQLARLATWASVETAEPSISVPARECSPLQFQPVGPPRRPQLAETEEGGEPELAPLPM